MCRFLLLAPSVRGPIIEGFVIRGDNCAIRARAKVGDIIPGRNGKIVVWVPPTPPQPRFDVQKHKLDWPRHVRPRTRAWMESMGPG